MYVEGMSGFLLWNTHLRPLLSTIIVDTTTTFPLPTACTLLANNKQYINHILFLSRSENFSVTDTFNGKDGNFFGRGYVGHGFSGHGSGTAYDVTRLPRHNTTNWGKLTTQSIWPRSLLVQSFPLHHVTYCFITTSASIIVDGWRRSSIRTHQCIDSIANAK